MFEWLLEKTGLGFEYHRSSTHMQSDLHSQTRTHKSTETQTLTLYLPSSAHILAVFYLSNKYLSLQLHTLHQPWEFTRIRYVSALAPPVYALSLTYTHTNTDAKAVKSWIKCFPGKAQRVLALLSRCCQKTLLLSPPLPSTHCHNYANNRVTVIHF